METLLNGKQNERIRALEVQVENIDKRFDIFLTNDFKHLEAKVSWVFGLVVLGVLIPILLFIIK